MDYTFDFKNKTVFLDKHPFVSFESTIEDILILKTSLIILLKYNSILGERNIFSYGFDQSLKWQIPQPVQIHSLNYYSSIYLTDNELYAYSISGVEYHLNIETGEILDSELIK